MPALSAESEKTGLKHRFRWLIAFTNLRSLGHKMRFELKKKFSWSYRAGQKCSNSIQEGSFPRFEELPTEIRVMIWELVLPEPRIVTLELRALKVYPFIRSGRIWSNWPTKSTHPPRSLQESVLLNTPADKTLSENYIEFPEELNLSNLSGFYSSASPPTLLFVCHESFAVASRHYTKSFGAICAAPTIWFDWKRDTLVLDGNLSTGRKDGYWLDHNRGQRRGLVGSQIFERTNFLEEIIPRIFKTDLSKVENLAIGMKGGLDDVGRVYIWIIWTMMHFKGVKRLTYELPSTAKSPGPWICNDGTVEYFNREEFIRWALAYAGQFGYRKRMDMFSWEGEIREECVSEL